MKEKFSDLKQSYLDIQRHDSGILKWMLLQGLVNAMIAYFSTISLGIIIDAIKDKTFHDGICIVLLIAGVNATLAVANLLLGRCVNYRRFMLSMNYQKDKTRAYFHVPYSYMETPEFQDLKQNIRFSDDNMGSFMGLLNNFENFFANWMNLITGCVVCLVLMFYPKMLGGRTMAALVAVIACILGISFIFMHAVKRLQKRSNDLTPGLFEIVTQGNRLAMYLIEYVVHNYPMGKDIRVYKADTLIHHEYQKMNDNMSFALKKIGYVSGLPGTVNNISGDIIKGIIYLALAAMAILKYITVGSVVIWANSITKVMGTYSGIVMSMGEFSILQKRLSYGKELFAIADGQVEDTSEAGERVQAPQEIVFQNVSYQYPNSSEWALKDVNFTIRKGDRVSIVGRNGAGKSTVVKLLCGMYEPTEGKILFDGRSKEEIAPAAYRKMMAAVFQDFKVLSFSIEDNILMGKSSDEKRLDETIQKCRLKQWIDSQEAGKNTFLFNDYENGVECSGGEAQRVALARCLYADAPIMIFDEPTAALDARTEMEVFENMREISADRTAIFVSHRLSSCLFSDRIFVFQDGRFVREGTHEELLKDSKCVYQELWNAQAQYYVS